MTARIFKGYKPAFLWISAVFFSVLFNVLLFCMMPALVSDSPSKVVYKENFHPVSLFRVKQKKPLPEKREIKKEIKVKRFPISIKNANINKKIELPKLGFDINPKIPGGPLFLPPSPEITSFDFSGFGLNRLNGVFDIGDVDSPPIPVAQTPPIYPFKAKRLGIEGSVKVKFLVTKKGKVKDVRIIEANPKHIFDNSVIRCVSSWHFSPGTVEGEPVDTLVATTIKFVLE